MSALSDLVKLARAAGAAGQSWDRWIMSDEAQDLIMSVDSFDQAEQDAIERAFAEGRAEKLAATGRIIYTTAPKDYDGGSAVELAVLGDFFGRPLRKIVVEPEEYDWQANRYASGTYGVWDKDPIEEDRRVQAEHDRHRAEMAAADAKHAAGREWLRTASDAELANEDLCWERGCTWKDVREEKERRQAAEQEEGRTSEWARVSAIIPEGATLIDDGEFIPAPMVGLRPIQRAAAIYYDAHIEHGWPDDIEHAQVVAAAERGTKRIGSAAHVADMLAKGKFRVAKEGEVPPRAVAARIGFERWRDIKRIAVGGKVVWVGRATFGSADLILDEKGKLVRAKKIVEAAQAKADEIERARISAVASSSGGSGHAWSEQTGVRVRRRLRRKKRGLRGRYGRAGWFGESGRHSLAARKGWGRRR